MFPLKLRFNGTNKNNLKFHQITKKKVFNSIFVRFRLNKKELKYLQNVRECFRINGKSVGTIY